MGNFKSISFQRTLKTSSPCHSACFLHLQVSPLKINLHVFFCATVTSVIQEELQTSELATDLKVQEHIIRDSHCHVNLMCMWGKNDNEVQVYILACFKIYYLGVSKYNWTKAQKIAFMLKTEYQIFLLLTNQLNLKSSQHFWKNKAKT